MPTYGHLTLKYGFFSDLELQQLISSNCRFGEGGHNLRSYLPLGSVLFYLKWVKPNRQ